MKKGSGLYSRVKIEKGGKLQKMEKMSILKDMIKNSIQKNKM